MLSEFSQIPALSFSPFFRSLLVDIYVAGKLIHNWS